MSNVPAEWTCPPQYFNDGFSCDCDCGPVIDPDCSIENSPVYNCADLQTCEEGVCVGGLESIPVPDGWDLCDPGYWNVNDGCDCGCASTASEATRDPDCDRPGTLWNCEDDQFCNALGQCADIIHSPTAAPHGPQVTKFPTVQPPAPEGWTCPEEYYADGFACDCDCGVVDLDCEIEGSPVYNCADLQTCSTDGQCVGGLEDIPVPAGWDQCDPGYWNVNDGCDCGCATVPSAGTRDPDCDRPGTLWNCQDDQYCDNLGQCADIIHSPTSAPHGPQVTKFPTIAPPPTNGAPTNEPEEGGLPAPEASFVYLAVGILAGAAAAIFVVCCVCGPKKPNASDAVVEEKKADVVVGAN